MRAVCAPKCLEKDARADFLCLHCYPNAVGDNTWAYFFYSHIFVFNSHIFSFDFCEAMVLFKCFVQILLTCRAKVFEQKQASDFAGFMVWAAEDK